MKEATGELNMTLITVVAIAAVGVIFVTLILPIIRTSVHKAACASDCGCKENVTSTSGDCKCGSVTCNAGGTGH